MYIEPSSTIRLLNGLPLDTTYEHTIYFSSISNQVSYFTSKTKHVLNNQSYQRVNRGKIRVEVRTDECYDCNYVMFQNTGYGNKWFYAFIVSVEFVNNETTEITFEIDDMQTWYFDYNIDPCFIEREHSYMI